MSDKSFDQKVAEIINDEIRPLLQGHGGDIELVSVEDDKTVKVILQGACSGCPGAKMTLKNGVEKLLKDKLPDLKGVIAVS